MPWRLKIVPDEEALGKAAAGLIAEQIQARPDSVLALPTGRTPLRVYRELATMDQRGELNLRRVRFFHLDEFYPMAAENPASFQAFLWREFLFHVSIDPANVYLLNGLAEDPTAECHGYEEQIAAAGGLDLVVLGIGMNGHIAFNEPGSPFDSRTRLVTLCPESRVANAYLFSSVDAVPRQGLTIGIGTIMEGRRILLIAGGDRKARAVSEAFDGSPRPSHPASYLRQHPDLTVILDQEAGSLLKGVENGAN
jgi:glucosamine-6-phosphate deaminase